MEALIHGTEASIQRPRRFRRPKRRLIYQTATENRNAWHAALVTISEQNGMRSAMGRVAIVIPFRFNFCELRDIELGSAQRIRITTLAVPL